MKIEQLEGTDKALYEAVAPLVMNPEVIRYNNGYPFKTGEKFVWFIARNETDGVTGFLPIERRGKEWIINNYYALPSDEEAVLEKLLHKAEKACDTKTALTVVAQTRHRALFEKHDFKPTKEWKLYLKMTKDNHGQGDTEKERI